MIIRITLVVAAILLCASTASAQFANNKGAPKGKQPSVPMPIQVPVAVPNAPNQKLTPQDQQQLMMWRAMQNRGRRGVQTGFPQFVPLGSPFGTMPGWEPYYYFDDFGAGGAGDDQPEDRAFAARKAQQEKREAERAEKEKKAKALKELKNKRLTDEDFR